MKKQMKSIFIKSAVPALAVLYLFCEVEGAGNVLKLYTTLVAAFGLAVMFDENYLKKLAKEHKGDGVVYRWAVLILLFAWFGEVYLTVMSLFLFVGAMCVSGEKKKLEKESENV